ncbi:DUF4227 family protein [Paenibacillus sp. NEAU-GSW1]|uniref:DUF4227 family protein n=1 Tax=Paenibacillus sp. NEAU-GSW1 TaxID=2682486 RepID=UPI0012E2324C|nr:DUF4227 family protein [Paenibacillus sp. NEAU-GSW1]MUT65552.1 DUF4227 family protein [Paenibacillus sp. NEAU-GSW1]
MILSLRKWASRILFAIIFMLLLIVATGGYNWIAGVISPVNPYQKPKGSALKVFQADPIAPDSGSVADRLRLFYWYGE